jgi:hypothetical protein
MFYENFFLKTAKIFAKLKYLSMTDSEVVS